QEGDAEGVNEEAPVAPGGGDEDEEMPQAMPPLPRNSMARDFSRFTTWTVTILARLMDKAGVPYTRHLEIKPGSKFSTIVREYVTEPSTLSESRAELRRESDFKCVKEAGEKFNLKTS
ncbi:hypothetical protein Tco_0896534, partial [Tanacetum coccineum]